MQDGEALADWPAEDANQEKPATSREKGLNRVLHMLEFLHANQRAIGMYEYFGFRSAGVRPRYYHDNGEDALIMWLD